MIELINQQLRFSFPDVHPKAVCSIDFQRTLRIPDDNQDYPLPAGLGRFPLEHVDDHPVPKHWKERGGIFMPMHQAEAMWINFSADDDYPFAIKIAAGKINAVSGRPWDQSLTASPQDYIVSGAQPWLDGFNAGAGIVRQFVAMPLGSGVTVEEQISGSAEWGGMQILVYPMKAEEYQRRIENAIEKMGRYQMRFSRQSPPAQEMGLAAGGRIRQKIAKDRFGPNVWDITVYSRLFVQIVNSRDYLSLTGKPAPTTPITPKNYRKSGIPWFEHYSDGPSVSASEPLQKIDGLSAALEKKGESLSDNKPIVIGQTIRIPARNPQVREGNF